MDTGTALLHALVTGGSRYVQNMKEKRESEAAAKREKAKQDVANAIRMIQMGYLPAEPTGISAVNTQSVKDYLGRSAKIEPPKVGLNFSEESPRLGLSGALGASKPAPDLPTLFRQASGVDEQLANSIAERETRGEITEPEARDSLMTLTRALRGGELPGLKIPEVTYSPDTLNLPIGNISHWKKLPKEPKEPKEKDLSTYGYNVYANVLADPSQRSKVMSDKNLSAEEKSYILEKTKPGAKGGGSSTLNFGNLSDAGAELYVAAAQSLASKEHSKADVIEVVNMNKKVPANEKAFIVNKLRTESLTGIIAELVGAGLAAKNGKGKKGENE